MIRAIALDQPGTTSEAALERQVDRLARLLRRSPCALRRALRDERAVFLRTQETLPRLKAVRKEMKLVVELLKQIVGMGARLAPAGMSLPQSENAYTPEVADGVPGPAEPGDGLRVGDTTVLIGVKADERLRDEEPAFPHSAGRA